MSSVTAKPPYAWALKKLPSYFQSPIHLRPSTLGKGTNASNTTTGNSGNAGSGTNTSGTGSNTSTSSNTSATSNHASSSGNNSSTNATTNSTNKPVFENLYPNDTPRQANIISNDRLRYMTNRNLAYVVLEDGSIIVGRNNINQGHIDLANGRPVVAAGEVEIDQVPNKPVLDIDGQQITVYPGKSKPVAVQEFPSVAKSHGFNDIIDNYAGQATKTTLNNGATLYQLEGSLNGVSGRFEWIVDPKLGGVSHRMFIQNGKINGVPSKP